ncbi:MAG: fimbrial protein FimV, partial [Burkholderiaceae bacterium]|nr:fimbrial protein FimV [Burkholderiaceae bacterium]
MTLLGVSVDAQAVALGAVTVRSALGEPLRAEIEVPELSSQDEASFQARMAPPPAFEAAGVAYAPALVGTTVTLQRRPNGQAYLKVVGDHPVNDPFLGLVIEATWDAGRVVRDYTMLIDPPGRGAPSPVIAQPSQIDPTDGQVALTAGDAQA